MNLLNYRGNLWLEQLGDPIDRSEMGNFQITSRRPRVRKKLLPRRVAWGRKEEISRPFAPADRKISPEKLTCPKDPT
jgi:hypothetical protein